MSTFSCSLAKSRPRMVLFLTLWCSVTLSMMVGWSEAKARHLKWDVEYMYWSPDCEERVVMGINGQFPGPTIRAHVGDIIHVDLTNKLGTEGVVIHWHGIRQLGTPWADGTASISQCPINPGQTFTYRFVVDKTLLMNGRGQYNCSLLPNFGNSSSTQCKFKGNEQCAPQVLRVLPNKTYRLRLASTTALASLNIAIGKHKMIVVEADGNYVQPFAVEDLDIYSGESYSVVIKTDQNPNQNYWISVGVRGRQPKTPPALTILNYKKIPSSKLPSISPPITPAWNDYNHSKSFTKSIFSLMGSPTPPASYDRRLLFLNTQNRIDGYIKWSINNVSFVFPPTPYLGSVKFGLKNVFDQSSPPEDFPASYDIMSPPANPNSNTGNGVYKIDYNTTVDIILQNANALAANTSEIHPWHLHGHDFWVLGYGEGKFTKGDEANFNLKNPPLRNTVVIFPYGWTALRFVADNPGAWPFHCHIEPHLHMASSLLHQFSSLFPSLPLSGSSLPFLFSGQDCETTTLTAHTSLLPPQASSVLFPHPSPALFPSSTASQLLLHGVAAAPPPPPPWYRKTWKPPMLFFLLQ
ncbi:hypothetical protein SOVF_049080 [Spinacia oleracea]|nr:hypothetical protein SOVF_049080 [Spinacia oleracea]